MLAPVILPDLFSAISLPALAAGATPCALPDGLTTDLFGQAVAHANPSAPPAPKKAPLMIDTSGLSGSISSASAALELSLVSKLKQRLTTDGSILFNLIWKAKATPAGRQVYRLRASGRRTLDKDSGSWPTPNCADVNASRSSTPQEYSERWMARKEHGSQLAHTAQALASWPTPQTMDTLPPMDYEKRLNHPGRPGRTVSGNLREVVTIVGWPTPIVGDTTGGPRPPDDKRGPAPGLQAAAHLTSWPMTSTRDYKGGYQGGRIRNGKISTDTLDVAAQLTSGQTAIGSPAATENRGQLSPAHSRWLMGLPKAWDECAPTLSKKSRKK